MMCIYIVHANLYKGSGQSEEKLMDALKYDRDNSKYWILWDSK